VIRSGVVLALAAGCSDDAGPWLDRASPAAAARGATIALAGRHLCGPAADCTTAAGEVQLGEMQPIVLASVVSYSDTEAQIVIPQVTSVGATSIIVTVNERSSNSLAFEVLP
jgi:hypothetical protein